MRFRTFDGTPIEDIVEYVSGALARNPTLTVSVGCDSSPQRPATYAVTVVLYDSTSKKGAHVVFSTQSHDLFPRDVVGRLQREYELALSVAELLDAGLSGRHARLDLTDMERKRYKYHLLCNDGLYPHLPYDEQAVISSVTLTEADRNANYRFVDIHMDYNPAEVSNGTRGAKRNKSNLSYRSWVPYLRSLGYRVFVKPSAFAASSAADILLH
jgi:predicted RNase H-related nuclease YkuK (DUF458 family)